MVRILAANLGERDSDDRSFGVGFSYESQDLVYILTFISGAGIETKIDSTF